MSDAPERTRRATGPGIDLIRWMHEMTERGLDVTVHKFPGFDFYFPEAHEPTNEARQACIDEFNKKYRTKGATP